MHTPSISPIRPQYPTYAPLRWSGTVLHLAAHTPLSVKRQTTPKRSNHRCKRIGCHTVRNDECPSSPLQLTVLAVRPSPPLHLVGPCTTVQKTSTKRISFPDFPVSPRAPPHVSSVFWSVQAVSRPPTVLRTGYGELASCRSVLCRPSSPSRRLLPLLPSHLSHADRAIFPLRCSV